MVYRKHMEINSIPDDVIDCLFDAIEKNNKLYIILKEDNKDNEDKIEKVFGKDVEFLDMMDLIQKKMFSSLMDAVSVFDNEPFLNKFGFNQITEIFYDLTRLEQSKKMLFNYALLGRRGKEGLLQTLGGGRLTKSAIFVPSSRAKEAENFIKKWNVEYLKKSVFVLGG
ncbi:MAG: hypothetical protein M1284_02175 [Candidatus Parvarchaeota archaeon]|nr:hypothetical protein [Candidatus Parvarchaeota archaeon]